MQEALFQLGTIYEKRGANDPAQLEQAAKTFELLLNKVPGDPNLCSRLGTYSLLQKRAHTPFFPFALNTVEAGALDMKDIVDRALIYSPLYYYMELILYVC